MAKLAPKYKEGATLLGHIGPFSDSPLDFLGTLHAQDDPTMSFRLAIVKAMYVSRPEDIKEIFRKPQVFTKGGLLVDGARRILGNGLPMSNGVFWARQRRIISNSFRSQLLQSYMDIFRRQAHAAVDRWVAASADHPYDVFEDLSRTSMDISVEALFGTTITKAEQEVILASIDFSLAEVNRRLQRGDIFPIWLPTPANKRLRQSMGAFRDIVLKTIEEKSKQEEPDYTIISLLLATQDEETGQYMKYDQIIDEVRSFFVAGAETTAATLAWTVYELAKHPDTLSKVRAELDQWQKEGELYTMHSIMELKYTFAVVQEAMRMYPAVWLQTRSVSRTTELGGYQIPKGTSVFFSAYWSGRDPQVWEDPDAFKPDRFLTELTPQQEMAFYPFAQGPRKCIGYRFAQLEMITVLATLCSRTEFHLPEDFEPAYDLEGSLVPKTGIPLYVKPRN